jgi:hypothetical protein
MLFSNVVPLTYPNIWAIIYVESMFDAAAPLSRSKSADFRSANDQSASPLARLNLLGRGVCRGCRWSKLHGKYFKRGLEQFYFHEAYISGSNRGKV